MIRQAWRSVVALVRGIFGISSPFCSRWGHDYRRGFGPGRESFTHDWYCADPECGAMGNWSEK